MGLPYLACDLVFSFPEFPFLFRALWFPSFQTFKGKNVFKLLSETLQEWKLVLKEQNQNELYLSFIPITLSLKS